MNDETAIDVRGVGKRYTKYEDTPMLISRALSLRNRTRRSTLWALRDASFTVGQGECVGVLGRNGSGKSTLLQMLAGVTAPTEGEVTVRGRVAPLISVGVGFHPELTGRENVYVNAAILGVTRADITERFDEIVAFSGIADFIDTPAKFYSSGMYLRLGFSVSVLAEPDVLLVDEVLAVGDMFFQAKCFERMTELKEAGTTIVIVSHNLDAIRRLCERTLVIHDGQLRHDGDTTAALSAYHDLIGRSRDVAHEPLRDEYLPRYVAHIEDVELRGPDGVPTRHVDSGQILTVSATIRFDEPIADPLLGVAVVSESGIVAYSEFWQLAEVGRLPGDDLLGVKVALKAALPSGSHTLKLHLSSWRHSLIAPTPDPLLFFAEGRPWVHGAADLGGELSTSYDTPSNSSGTELPE